VYGRAFNRTTLEAQLRRPCRRRFAAPDSARLPAERLPARALRVGCAQRWPGPVQHLGRHGKRGPEGDLVGNPTPTPTPSTLPASATVMIPVGPSPGSGSLGPVLAAIAAHHVWVYGDQRDRHRHPECHAARRNADRAVDEAPASDDRRRRARPACVHDVNIAHVADVYVHTQFLVYRSGGSRECGTDPLSRLLRPDRQPANRLEHLRGTATVNGATVTFPAMNEISGLGSTAGVTYDIVLFTVTSALATPTATPTMSPTASPTASPTSTPTSTPTATPTQRPHRARAQSRTLRIRAESSR